jgi:hypothetical protein
MKIISHRGNLFGNKVDEENKKSSVVRAIELGFDVEIDFWHTEKGFFLGHDSPEESVTLEWLYEVKDNLWVHSKNLDSIRILKQTELNWFWHENDRMTITSKGFIWCNYNVIVPESIIVELDYKILPDTLYGVCTDKPLEYRK